MAKRKKPPKTGIPTKGATNQPPEAAVKSKTPPPPPKRPRKNISIDEELFANLSEMKEIVARERSESTTWDDFLTHLLTEVNASVQLRALLGGFRSALHEFEEMPPSPLEVLKKSLDRVPSHPIYMESTPILDPTPESWAIAGPDVVYAPTPSEVGPTGGGMQGSPKADLYNSLMSEIKQLFAKRAIEA